MRQRLHFTVYIAAMALLLFIFSLSLLLFFFLLLFLSFLSFTILFFSFLSFLFFSFPFLSFPFLSFSFLFPFPFPSFSIPFLSSFPLFLPSSLFPLFFPFCFFWRSEPVRATLSYHYIPLLGATCLYYTPPRERFAFRPLYIAVTEYDYVCMYVCIYVLYVCTCICTLCMYVYMYFTYVCINTTETKSTLLSRNEDVLVVLVHRTARKYSLTPFVHQFS